MRTMRSIGVAAVSVALLASAVAGNDLVPARETAAPLHVPMIDARAPGLFDGAAAPMRGLQVRYRVDAKVLLPLGFTALELWSRPDVGWVTASYRDLAAEDGAMIRGYELFSASRPERAHGLDRMGFFREAIRLSPVGAEWTAYFGAMSSSPERSYSEAAKAVESKAPRVYDVTDGLTTATQARASVFKVSTESPASNASQLYAAICPLLDQPRRTPVTDGSPARPLPSLAFLGALESTLQVAASTAARFDAKRARVPFAHNGGIKQIEITSLKRDVDRGRQLVAKGFVRNVNDVYCLNYRVTSRGNNDGEFRLWAELPAGRQAADTPIAPIAWEFEPRSFLRLYVERVQ